MEVSQAANGISNDTLFARIDAYDWESDAEFQTGLRSILSSNPAPDQRDHWTQRAKCFYYARKSGQPVDFDAYLSWKFQQGQASLPLLNGESRQEVSPSSENEDRNSTLRHGQHELSEEPPAPYPNTFSQIVELISSGQPIPGIKEVPGTVLEGQCSAPVAGKRRKPWEKDEAHA